MGCLLRLHETNRRDCRWKNTPAELLEIPEVARALEQFSLFHALVRCLTEGDVSTPSKGILHTETIVARFEEFLEANPNTPLYLAEARAGVVGSAERSPRAGCANCASGIGPIRYLTLTKDASGSPRALWVRHLQRQR